MKPIAKEKRELLVLAKKCGEKEEKIALWLEISVRSVSRIWKLYQETITLVGYFNKDGSFGKKKTLFPKEQLREDVQKERAERVEKMEGIDLNRLVFSDETSVNCAMTRLYGRACENAWSKSKSTLRKLKARNEPKLEESMGLSLQFSSSDLLGWFEHCGCNVNI